MAIDNIPCIQPDEWLNGYLERLSIHNGYKDAKSAFNKLSVKTEKLDYIAKLLDRTTESLVQEHTLIPALRGIVSSGEGITHGNPAFPTLISKNGFHGYSEQVRFCHQCQREDVGYLGYQYVRRSHQLYGALWCQKHTCALHEVPKDEIGKIIRSDPEVPVELHNQPIHPIIERFIHISDALLSVKHSTHGDQVSWGLSKRAAAKGIRFHIKGRGIPLSDYANQTTPHEWLHSFFPTLKEKIPGEFIKVIDGSCVFRLQHHAPPTYILAAALLFENADDALNCILNKDKIPTARKIVRRNERFWTSEDLYNLYVAHKGNCLTICKEIEGDYDTVRVNLIKHGLPPLTGLSRGTLKALMDFHHGENIIEILSRNNIQTNYFNRTIRHSSPKFFMALEKLNTALIQQRKELKLRLTGKIKLTSKASIFLKGLHDENKSPCLV